MEILHDLFDVNKIPYEVMYRENPNKIEDFRRDQFDKLKDFCFSRSSYIDQYLSVLEDDEDNRFKQGLINKIDHLDFLYNHNCIIYLKLLDFYKKINPQYYDIFYKLYNDLDSKFNEDKNRFLGRDINYESSDSEEGYEDYYNAMADADRIVHNYYQNNI